MSTEAIRASSDDAATTELVAGAVGDRCPNCDAPMASDQRYCVSCGERRGKPRFSFAQLSAGAAVPFSPQPGPEPAMRFQRGPGMTLVAGIATLLIAIGVGVLIGHNSNSSPTRASGLQVVTVGGGTAANGSAQSGGTGALVTGAAGSSSKAGKVKPVTHVPLPHKVTAAATSAASKVLGSSGNLSKNVTQKQGGSCSGGAGCQNGKFTGNFFGGG